MNIFLKIIILFVAVVASFSQSSYSTIRAAGYYYQLSDTSCEGRVSDDKQITRATLQDCADKCSLNPYCSSFDFPNDITDGDLSDCRLYFNSKHFQNPSKAVSCFVKNLHKCNQSYPFAFLVDADTHQYGCCQTPIAVTNSESKAFCASKYYNVSAKVDDFDSAVQKSSDRFCECETSRCELETSVETTTTDFNFGRKFQYLPIVEEMYLEFYQSDTHESLQAQGCRGPQNRVEGGEWFSQNRGLCACQKENDVKDRMDSEFFCNPLSSCNYDSKMDGVRGLSAMQYHANTEDKLSCKFFLNFAQAEQWCVYTQECIGLLKTWHKDEYCVVLESTVFKQFTVNVVTDQTDPTCTTAEQTQFETPNGCKCCVNFQLEDGNCKPSHDKLFLLKTFEADFKTYVEDPTVVIESVNPSDQLVSCNLQSMRNITDPSNVFFEDAKKLNFFTYDGSGDNLPTCDTKLFDGKYYTGSLSSAKAFANLCNKDFFYFSKNNEDPQLSTYQFPNEAVPSLPPGKYTKYSVANEVQTYTPCQPRLNCVHGTSIYNSELNKCECRCDQFWTGALCDECTSQNKQSDCKRCKENFNTGFNDMCICTSGYDISTGCTTCLPGIAGAFCQTDLCSYTFHEALDAKAVNLNNIVIAYNHEQVLYDGIKSAGDGRIPLSMQNTFALRDDKLWWLNETRRHYVHNTSHMPQPLENLTNVHRLKGEWLSSIQESQEEFTRSNAFGIEFLPEYWIIRDPDFSGHVCQHAGPFKRTIRDVKSSLACATECADDFKNPTKEYDESCGSWHYKTDTELCGIYTVKQMQDVQFDVFKSSYTASEYNINDNCVSGGLYGAGPNRNLPNEPSFAVPDDEEMLKETPPELRSRVVCAYDDNVPYVLSEFRRHKLTSSLACNDEYVVLVQFTWLYSIPRGAPFTILTTREQWWTVDAYPDTSDANRQTDAKTIQQCKTKCNKNSVCFLWVFDLESESCYITDGTVLQSSLPSSRFYYGGVLRNSLSDQPELHDITQRPNMLALPSRPELAASVPSRQACCDMCSEFLAWDMAGALCSCFGNPQTSTATKNDTNAVRHCRVSTVLKEGSKCSGTYEMQIEDEPFWFDPQEYFGCTLIQKTLYFDTIERKAEETCKSNCETSTHCDVVSFSTFSPGEDTFYDCRWFNCPHLEESKINFKIKHNY